MIVIQRRPKTGTYLVKLHLWPVNSAQVFLSNHETYPQSSYTPTSVTEAQPLLPEKKRVESHVPSHSLKWFADNLKMSRALFLGDIYLEEVNTCSGHCLYNSCREHVRIIFLTDGSISVRSRKKCSLIISFGVKTIFSPVLDQFPSDKP